MPDVGRKAPKATHTQSVIFDKEQWTRAKARAWCEEHDYYSDGSESTETSFRFRQFDPNEEMFRYRIKDLGGGVSLMIGFLAEGKKEMADNQGVQYAYEHDAESNTYTIKDVEVFAVGRWNGDYYDDADLQAMCDADAELHELIRPRAKVGHAGGETAADAPAYGWLGKLRKMGEKIVADIARIPVELFEAFRTGRYARQSVEVRLNYKHPETGKRYPFVVDALAFLGAKLPAIPTLKPIAAFETGYKTVRLYKDNAQPLVIEQEAARTEPPAGAAAVEPRKEEGGSEMEEKELKAGLDKLAEERAAFEKVQSAGREKMEQDSKRLLESRIGQMWSTILSSGHAKPAEEESFKAIARGINDSDKLTFADADGKRTEGTALDAHFASWMTRPILSQKTEASRGTPEEDKRDVVAFFQDEAEKVAEKRKISFADALGEVSKLHPDKYEEYHEQCFKPLRESGRGGKK